MHNFQWFIYLFLSLLEFYWFGQFGNFYLFIGGVCSGGQRTTCWSLFLPFIMNVLRTKLRLSGLATSAFTCRALLPSQSRFFLFQLFCKDLLFYFTCMSVSLYVICSLHVKRADGLTSLTNTETKTVTTWRFHLIPSIMAQMKERNDSACFWGCGERGTLIHCCWECKLVKPLLNQWGGVSGLKIDIPLNPALQLLDIHTKGLTCISTPMFTAFLSRKWKQLRCLSREEEIMEI